MRTCNQDSYIPRRGESSSRRREEAKAEFLKVLPGKDWHKSREARRTMWYDPSEWAGHRCFREEGKAEEPIGFEGQVIGLGDEVIVGDCSCGDGAET